MWIGDYDLLTLFSLSISPHFKCFLENCLRISADLIETSLYVKGCLSNLVDSFSDLNSCGFSYLDHILLTDFSNLPSCDGICALLFIIEVNFSCFDRILADLLRISCDIWFCEELFPNSV